MGKGIALTAHLMSWIQPNAQRVFVSLGGSDSLDVRSTTATRRDERITQKVINPAYPFMLPCMFDMNQVDFRCIVIGRKFELHLTST